MARRTSPATDDDDPFAFLDEEEPKKPRKDKKSPQKKEAGRREMPASSGAESKPAKGMPPEAPVLTSDDMCYDGDGGEGKRRSLDWWLYWTFFTCKARKGKFADEVASQKLKEVLTERYGKKVRCMWTFEEYMGKHKDRSLLWLAACWNETLRRLGYEIPERRCKDPGK